MGVRNVRYDAAVTYDVEVALIADTDAPFEPGPIDERFYAIPYRERRRVKLKVDEAESLARVLSRAADLLGLKPLATHWTGDSLDMAHRKIAFYRPEDEEAFQPRPQGRMMLQELTLVDGQGRAIFGVHDLRSVRYADVVRAAECGVIDGDPFRPYLILDDGWGDVPPVDWATVWEGLDVAWDVVKAVAVAGGAVAAVEKARSWIKQRLRHGREALAANAEWAQRGYRPDQFAALLAARDWDATGLAGLLSCSQAEAEAILWTLGFSFDDDSGRWRSGGEPAAEFLNDLVDAISWSSHAGGEWQPRLRTWLIRYLETGNRPPFELLDVAPPDDLPMYRPTLGERLDGFLARFRSH